jgi:hypothetical protein
MEEKALEGRTPTRVRFEGLCSACGISGASFPFPVCIVSGSTAHAVDAMSPTARRASGGPRGVDAENGETSEVTLVPSWKRDGAGEGQERRGPQRGTAGREEQDPEGRTPWMLGGRRIVSRREPLRIWPNGITGPTAYAVGTGRRWRWCGESHRSGRGSSGSRGFFEPRVRDH